MIGRTNSMLGKTILYSHYFGDGSDGDLTVKAGQTETLACALDVEQIYRQYNNLTIEAGGILKPANRCNGMVLLVKGDLTVNGTISADKCAPLANNMESYALSVPQVRLCNLTGGKGGNGGVAYGAGNKGTGGIGGTGHKLGGGFGAGGGAMAHATLPINAATAYNGGDTEPRPPAGISFPYLGTVSGHGLYGAGGGVTNNAGGASPGGSGAVATDDGTTVAGVAGDAYGGGALWIFVKGNVTIGSTGVISANGGNGAAGAQLSSIKSGGGGAGGGGIIAIVYNKAYTNEGTIRAHGGVGGSSGTYTALTPVIHGEDGGLGEILVTTLTNLLRSAENE